MQVYNTLQVAEERERLMQIKHLIIGGGAIDEALEAELRHFPNAVWSTYGMTETLSHIALRRINGGSRANNILVESIPPSFGGDGGGFYTPFPDVSVSLNGEGCLVVDAPGVCAQRLVTNDCAELHPDGRRFRIIGRKDNVINSGGIKIHAEEVEQMLRPHLSMPFIITKAPDPKFGEIVVMVYEDPMHSLSKEYLLSVCKSVLPKYWLPRRYIAVEKVAMTETGKPRRDISIYA
jgi:O-succinylbenzoic acid--CoA ligase